jgi:hypothetical protein
MIYQHTHSVYCIEYQHVVSAQPLRVVAITCVIASPAIIAKHRTHATPFGSLRSFRFSTPDAPG